MKKLVIVGASGFGREIAWIVERINRTTPDLVLLGFCDDAEDKQAGACGAYPLLGSVERAPAHGAEFFFCAIGNNRARQTVTARALAAGLRPLTLIDPGAVIAPDAVIGEGSYVGIGSVVSTGSCVGSGVIVNHHVTVGHDVRVGGFAQLCPGVRVSGGCQLGEGVLMGSNAVAIPLKRIGDWATLGAGSTAFADVPAGTTRVKLGK